MKGKIDLHAKSPAAAAKFCGSTDSKGLTFHGLEIFGQCSLEKSAIFGNTMTKHLHGGQINTLAMIGLAKSTIRNYFEENQA